jgi:hypothetical protein
MLTPVRHAPVGQWHRTEEGSGALLLDPTAVRDEPWRERLVQLVLRLQEKESPGTVGVADVIAEGERVWLVAAGPVEPTLADLLARPGGPGPGGARAVLHDVAVALLALHEVGIVHGGLSAHAVVVRPDGAALLNEVGLVPLLLGRPASAEADVAAWSSLADSLAAAWGGRDLASITAAATTAHGHGLSAALARLEPSTADRAALRDAVTAPSRATVTTPFPAPPPPPVLGPAPAPQVAAAPASQAPPQAGMPAGAPTGQLAEARATSYVVSAPPPPPPPPPARLDPAATMLGSRRKAAAPAAGGLSAATDRTGSGPIRFGPGVAAAVVAGQATPAALLTLEHAAARRAQQSDRTRRRRNRTRLLTTVLIVALVVGWLLWRNSWTAYVHGVRVTATPAVPGPCARTVDFEGTVDAGGFGQVRYQWTRSDGTQSAVEHADVYPWAGTVHVHLYWSFSGPGRYRAVAQLKVWASSARSARADVIYHCP